MEKIGLIAGGGKLPVIFAREARKKGAKVIGFAIKEMALPEFGEACNRVHWFSIGQFRKAFLMLFLERIKKIIMLGRVDKSVIYSNIRKDAETKDFLKDTGDKKDYTLLERITRELSKRGIEVISGIDYISDFLPAKGILTKRKLSVREREDVSFGYKVAREIANLDIGQTVVVKDKAVVSVEAMEGTNEAVKRSAKLCGEGFVVIKAARPKQDMRWDVPVVGPETISIIAREKGSVLAIEEKKMFLVDREASVRLADNNNISIAVI